jgi:hypothetical protein
MLHYIHSLLKTDMMDILFVQHHTDIQEHIHSLVDNTTLHYNSQLQDLSLLLHNWLSLENNPLRYNCHLPAGHSRFQALVLEMLPYNFRQFYSYTTNQAPKYYTQHLEIRIRDLLVVYKNQC